MGSGLNGRVCAQRLGVGNDRWPVPNVHVLGSSAQAAAQSFVELNDLKLVSIGERELDLATQAYAEFGKGRHPAALNMGDCFAYACAKANRSKLLFKGEDFTKTDITPAG